MLPICEVCAKTGILCGACESKLQKGKINPLDVELSKILYGLSKGKIGFERAIDIEDFIIILTEKDYIGKIIGKDGVNIRTISTKLGKQVRVIGTGDFREMVYDLVAPARVIGVNKVHKPDGTILQRIRINRRDKARLRMGLEDLERVISTLSQDKIEIKFE